MTDANLLSFLCVSVRERAVVRYSYAAENEDELELQKGQVIEIVKKDLEDPGWWKGQANSKTGVFPDNFVELLPTEEEHKQPDDPARVVNIKLNAYQGLPFHGNPGIRFPLGHPQRDFTGI